MLDDFRKSIDIMKYGDRTCKGLLFRGYSSTFYNESKGTIDKREGLRLLKKQSCHGKPCESYDGEHIESWRCDWSMLEYLNDLISSGSVIMPDIENGALYKVRTINQSRDWETGVLDSWDIEFYKVEENKNDGQQ